MFGRLAIALLAAAAFTGAASAQDPSTSSGQGKYPSRVIRFVTAAPGSNHDWGARVTASELSSRIGQRVVVENRGAISIEYVAKEAPADGYTVLFYGAVVWLQPFLRASNWDPLADFAPVTLAITSPNVLVVHPSLPVKNTKEMIALARSKPAQLNYGAGGGGSTPHMAAELFNHMANVKITRVNYKGSGPAQIGLITGEVQVMFAGLGPIQPHVKSGKARALAVTSEKRSKLTPEWPTVAETVPGYSSEAAIGFFLPKKTPPAIVAWLNREISAALRATDPEKVAHAGVEVVAGTPEEFTAFMKADMARMGPVIRGGGFAN